MLKALRVFGWLGTAWAVFVGVIGILVMLSMGGGIDPGFCLWVLALFIASVRLIYLRRWAALALSAYSVWMIKDSLHSGLQLWNLAWIAVSITLVTLTIRAWGTLRSGL